MNNNIGGVVKIIIKMENEGGGATVGLLLHALALPIRSQGFVTWAYCRALVNARRCCLPGLNKFPNSLL